MVFSADQDLESIFTAEHNLGVRLGASKLVDADLDSHWARALADAFLPKSTMVWGRASEPASHRAYEVKSASAVRSEERRVGKECRARWTGCQRQEGRRG